MARVTWHGHATCTLETDDGVRLVIDPFFVDNPSFEGQLDAIEADFILCTHGHSDHFADCIPLAERTGATVVSTYEIIGFLQSRGIENVHALHIGGGAHFPFGYVKMTPALHGGKVYGDESGAFTTMPGGFLIRFDAKSFHHAGDTALLMEMQLLRGDVDVAMLPIGDTYTMGPDDAVRAVEFICPKVVIPIHYDTFDEIAQDADEFRRKVANRARVELLKPGESYEF